MLRWKVTNDFILLTLFADKCFFELMIDWFPIFPISLNFHSLFLSSFPGNLWWHLRLSISTFKHHKICPLYLNEIAHKKKYLKCFSLAFWPCDKLGKSSEILSTSQVTLLTRIPPALPLFRFPCFCLSVIPTQMTLISI